MKADAKVLDSFDFDLIGLFSEKQYDILKKYAYENQNKIMSYWTNNDFDSLQYILKYASSKLYFFESFLKQNEELYSVFRMGALIGTNESYEKLRHEEQYNKIVAEAAFQSLNTIKYLDSITKLLERYGLLTHAEISNHLSLKTSTLTEAIKKIKDTGIINIQSSGKYKIYSLTDLGVRYGRFLREQEKDNVEKDDFLKSLKLLISSLNSKYEIKELEKNILSILEVDAVINNGDKIMVHIDSPRYLEMKNLQVEKIENEVNERIKIDCKYSVPDNTNQNIIDAKIMKFPEKMKA